MEHTTIGSIEFQSDLLALNASLEGAQADGATISESQEATRRARMSTEAAGDTRSLADTFRDAKFDKDSAVWGARLGRQAAEASDAAPAAVRAAFHARVRQPR
jgi:hypothetical protein